MTLPFVAAWVTVTLRSSPSSSKQLPRARGSSISASASSAPSQKGGSLTAATLFVVTVTGSEVSWPSVAVYVKLSAPTSEAV